MMRGSVAVSDLTWVEYQESIARQAVVVLPVGALEQHGLHLPMGTDSFIVEAIGRRVAQRIGGLVLPTVTYGARSLPRSGGGDQFPGTTNLDGTTLMALIRDIVREQARHNVNRLVVLAGHAENDPFVVEGAELGRRDAGAISPEILVVGWWHVVPEAALAPIFPEGFPGWDLEHAARIETAMMLALAPGSVRTEALADIDHIVTPPYVRFPTPRGVVPSQGSLSDPRGPSGEIPEPAHALIELIVTNLANLISETFDLESHAQEIG